MPESNPDLAAQMAREAQEAEDKLLGEVADGAREEHDRLVGKMKDPLERATRDTLKETGLSKEAIDQLRTPSDGAEVIELHPEQPKEEVKEASGF